MRSSPVSSKNGAFTLVELLCVIAIIGILAAMLLPALTQGKSRAKLVWCGNNLAQVGLGFQSFAHEHDSKFPLAVRVSDGGALGTGNPNANGIDFSGVSFQAMAADLATPAIVTCPTDTRLPATSFARLQPANVSYFTSINASYDAPESVVAGDRNISAGAGATAANGTQQFYWTQAMHQLRGNLLYADGHVAAAKDFLLAGGYTPPGSGGASNPSTPGGTAAPAAAGITPLSPAQISAISTLLSHVPMGFPAAAALQPLLNAPPGTAPDSFRGPNHAATAGNGSSGLALLAEPATNVPAARLQTNLLAAPAATEDDPAVGNIIVRRDSPATSHLVTGGSWLLLILALGVLAHHLWRRTRKATGKRTRLV